MILLEFFIVSASGGIAGDERGCRFVQSFQCDGSGSVNKCLIKKNQNLERAVDSPWKNNVRVPVALDRVFQV